jgi:hypothetical protein
MWVVEAEDRKGEGVYTYLVDAPEDADRETVLVCAYAKHGVLHAEGDVPTLLGPKSQAFWQEVTPWSGD